MSRAFVKETDGDAVALPDRQISPHPNFVTGRGLAGIEFAIDRFEAARRAAAAAMALRELRYWRARRASAELVKSSEDKSKASCGMTVTIRRDGVREQIFKIVGEDEPDPPHGTVSYVSPLARAVLAHGPGETITIANREAVILALR